MLSVNSTKYTEMEKQTMNLDSLLAKDSVNCEDFRRFLKTLATSLKNFDQREFFLSRSKEVKRIISSFKIIFTERKTDSELKTFISKTCTAVTVLYSKLSECFHQFEPDYVLELYGYWKEVLCYIKPSSLAKSCEKNAAEMQRSVSHLRAAPHRLQQMAILNVLCRYTEKVDPKALKNTQENDLLVAIAGLGKNPSPKSIHTLLSYVNVQGDNILTVKSTKVTPIDFQANYIKQKQEVWLDFNLKHKSVAFVVLSSLTDEFLCSGIVSSPTIQDCLLKEHCMLILTGRWNFLCGSNAIQTPGKITKMAFSCHSNDYSLISSVENLFTVSRYRNYGVGAANGQHSDLESVGAKTATLLFNDSTTDDYDEDAETTPAKSAKLVHDSSAEQLSSIGDRWTLFLTESNETEERFSHNDADNNFDVNYICNENRNNINETNQSVVTSSIDNSFIQQRKAADNNVEATVREEIQNFTHMRNVPGLLTTRRHTVVVLQRNINKTTKSKSKTKSSQKVIMSIDRESRKMDLKDRIRETNEGRERPTKRVRLNEDPHPPQRQIAGHLQVIYQQLSTQVERMEGCFQMIRDEIEKLRGESLLESRQPQQ